MVRKSNIRLVSTIFMVIILGLSLTGLRFAEAANPLDEIKGNQDTMMGNQSTMTGNQNTMMGNQDTMIGNQDTMMGNQGTSIGNQEAIMETLNYIMERLDHMQPTWDQKFQCDEIACPRFEVVLEGNMFEGKAVLDKETGLVWQWSPSKDRVSWDYAKTFCLQASTGNRFGWRLPTVEEFRSLLIPGQYNPSLPVGHPFDTDCSGVWDGCVQWDEEMFTGCYWTDTTHLLPSAIWYPLNARCCDLYDGSCPERDKDGSEEYYWCVRGGHGNSVN